jgi:hypothetical protein
MPNTSKKAVKRPLKEQMSDILDRAQMGNEPTKKYLESVSHLDNVVRQCMGTSHNYAGIQAPSGRHYYASVLFTTLLVRSISLLNLVPHSPWSNKKIEHWDYASAMGVTRTIMEVRLSLYYLCVEECSSEEWDCRLQLFNLHDCLARRKMFEAQGNTNEVAGFEKHAEEVRDHLRANSHFLGLQNGRKKNVLNAKSAYLYPLEDIAVKAGVDKSTYKWTWVFFSSHVHGLPMSFYRISGGKRGRGQGLPSTTEQAYTSLCLSLATTLLVRSRDEMQRLYADVPLPVKSKPNIPKDDEIEKMADEEDKFPVGATAQIGNTNDIRIEAWRCAPDIIRVRCVYERSGETVLERALTEKEGSFLISFDKSFWTVTLNGEPATEKMIEDMRKEAHAFRIDLDNRIIKFKA